MLAVIIILSAIILYNLSDFCLPCWEPSRYILFLEVGILNSSKKKKAGNLGFAALVIILICLVIIVIPTYFTIEVLVNKISDAKAYTESITSIFLKNRNLYSFQNRV